MILSRRLNRQKVRSKKLLYCVEHCRRIGGVADIYRVTIYEGKNHEIWVYRFNGVDELCPLSRRIGIINCVYLRSAISPKRLCNLCLRSPIYLLLLDKLKNLRSLTVCFADRHWEVAKCNFESLMSLLNSRFQLLLQM